MPRRAAQPALADRDAAVGGIATLDRALSLLGAFNTTDSTLSLAELAERTSLYKSTVLRMLASLEHAQLIRRLDSGRYLLGIEVERLHRVFEHSFSLESVVVPVLQALVRQTQESAAFYVPSGTHQRLCLHRVDSPRPVRDHMKAGDLLPIDRGAGGRILRAFSGASGATAARIRRELTVMMVGDRVPELAGIGAPVFDSSGALAGALTLTMPAERLDPDCRAPVLAAAQRITSLLGGRYPERKRLA